MTPAPRTLAQHWRRPGGPWDTPPLDAALPMNAVVDGDVRLSPAELERRVAALAGAMRRRGVRRGTAVAWQLPNWHETVALYRACWRLGATAVPLHHAAGRADVAAAIAQAPPAMVLSADGAPASDVDGALVVRGDRDGFTTLLDEGSSCPVASPAPSRPSDVAVVLFTSGSTGTPKAVLHSHRGLAYKAKIMRRIHALGVDDAVLMPAPLAHVSGLLNAVLLPARAGMATVLMDRWEPEQAIDLIERERVSFMVGPPTFFVTLIGARSFTPSRVGTLRLVSSGGAGVTPGFVDEATAALGCTVKRTYGSTEAPTVTTSHAGDPAERARATDGRAAGEVELRLGDGDELQVRGPELFVRYADAEATRAAHARGGWFRTGDVARIDDGWVTIVGRLKEVIIRGGENVSAAEVEAVLEDHPAVRQAVAVGIPDPRLGERVAALVVADAFDLDACRAWFDHRGVTRFKWPEHLVLVDVLPVLGSGKPDRAAARVLATRTLTATPGDLEA